MMSWIIAIFIFIVAVSCCCASDGKNSNTPRRNTTTKNTYTQENYRSYCECPSCGSPYYDGYCEECGYPDINQGWLGENY